MPVACLPVGGVQAAGARLDPRGGGSTLSRQGADRLCGCSGHGVMVLFGGWPRKWSPVVSTTVAVLAAERQPAVDDAGVGVGVNEAVGGGRAEPQRSPKRLG